MGTFGHIGILDIMLTKLFFSFKNQKTRTIKNREDKIGKYIAGEFTTKKEIESLAPFNFNSTNQLRELLFMDRKGFRFDIVKYTVDKKTKKDSGQYNHSHNISPFILLDRSPNLRKYPQFRLWV